MVAQVRSVVYPLAALTFIISLPIANTFAVMTKKEVSVDKIIQAADLEFINNIFKGKKVFATLDCEFESRILREQQAFKNKTVWTDLSRWQRAFDRICLR